MAKQRQKSKSKTKHMHVMQPNSTGIDVGATEINVAVPEDRSSKSVRRFDTFTDDLHEAAKWLKECGIESIAMESTGVYWIPVFQILDTYGFDIILVNARHVKNVPGRKTDVQDCQWLQYLHSVGLLRGSFRPDQDICAARSLLRHRDNMVKAASSHIQHIQKALTQMNLQIHNVISNITGVTGLAVIDAILAGERNPDRLADLKNSRIKADRQTIVKSLTGDYRSEHIFTLKQTLQSYCSYRQMIQDCDAEIERHLKEFESRIDLDDLSEPPAKNFKRKPKGNELNFDLKTHMHRLLGTDLTQFDGISLSPNNKIRGGKVLSSNTRPGLNRVAQALRISANSLWNCKSYLGDYFRRMRARHGAPKAITATAHKLARIIYHLVKNQRAFDETIFSEQEINHQIRLKKRIINQAKSLGLQLVPA